MHMDFEETPTVDVQPLPGYVDVPDESELVTNSERHIVSVKPMVAKRSKRSGYTSVTTNQRTWSDGTVDYACTECDYWATARISASRHYGSTHSKGKGVQPTPPSFPATVPDAKRYAPRQSRIEALAEALKDAVAANGVIIDWEDVARSALTWVHEQTGDLSHEAEPMTDSETLARIRRLLDTGQMAESQARITDLEGRLVWANRLADDATARADKVQATLDTLIDLVGTLREEKGVEPDTDQQS